MRQLMKYYFLKLLSGDSDIIEEWSTIHLECYTFNGIIQTEDNTDYCDADYQVFFPAIINFERIYLNVTKLASIFLHEVFCLLN